MKPKNLRAKKPTSSTEPSETDEPRHPPTKNHRLLGPVQAFRKLRDTESTRNLLAACRKQAGRYWRSTWQDHEDIIHEALIEVLEAERVAPVTDRALAPVTDKALVPVTDEALVPVTDEEFADKLSKALEKLRKRLVRRPETPVAPEKLEGSTQGHDVTLVTQETAGCLVSVLFRHLGEALPLLRHRDRIFVLRYYKLEEYFEPGDEVVVAINPETERKALYRARQRLSSVMEERLVKELQECPPESRDRLIEALKIVKGERYPEALAELLDLMDGRSVAL